MEAQAEHSKQKAGRREESVGSGDLKEDGYGRREGREQERGCPRRVGAATGSRGAV